ncbi:oocyte zinc finger protein XlCOF7.1-like [Rhinoderma darwinii]|uniref:oocyte zinc finger protein XlCOF7.1-like n=1 Tax=Rhinoderma darwinii TaxID=43563 RepID=UPI003F674DAC
MVIPERPQHEDNVSPRVYVTVKYGVRLVSPLKVISTVVIKSRSWNYNKATNSSSSCTDNGVTNVCSTRSSSFLILSSTTFLLLNDRQRRDEDRNEMSRRILDFTLEIIYLLSGEEYTIVKKTSGDCTTPVIHESGGWSSSQSPITEPPPHSRIHEKKILELIYKMTELLTGEVPIRCQDVTVYFSMEEWEYLEGHKDLYE